MFCQKNVGDDVIAGDNKTVNVLMVILAADIQAASIFAAIGIKGVRKKEQSNQSQLFRGMCVTLLVITCY